jgi:hypothetical protein
VVIAVPPQSVTDGGDSLVEMSTLNLCTRQFGCWIGGGTHCCVRDHQSDMPCMLDVVHNVYVNLSGFRGSIVFNHNHKTCTS